jgi:hypothetical protein
MLVFLIRSRKLFQVDYLHISDEARIPCRVLASGIAAIRNKLLPLTSACRLHIPWHEPGSCVIQRRGKADQRRAKCSVFARSNYSHLSSQVPPLLKIWTWCDSASFSFVSYLMERGQYVDYTQRTIV